VYDLALSLWRQGRLTVEQLARLVALGRLTQAQADEIQGVPPVG
jgi:hypothetical protein